MDQILKEAGRGLSDFINSMIHSSDKLIGGLINKVADIGGSAVAGVSGIIDNIGNVASSISFSPSAPAQEEGVKLGGNADKARIREQTPQDMSPYAASLDNIQLPQLSFNGVDTQQVGRS